MDLYDDSYGTISSNQQNLIIGSQVSEGSGGGTFDGWIDEVYLFSRALSSQEIQGLYLEGLRAADRIPPTGTIRINAGAAYTSSTQVQLELSATDGDVPLGSDGSMQFSNDGLIWSASESYAADKSWSLSQQHGSATVYARFIDAAGNVSPVVSATIIVDRAPLLSLAGAPQQMLTGQQLIFVLNVSDPDNDALSFSAGPLPSGARFITGGTPLGPNPVFLWYPQRTQAGSYQITFNATDSLGLNSIAVYKLSMMLDSEAPSVPFLSGSLRSNSVYLAWSSASDNSTSVFYLLTRNGAPLTRTSSKNYTDYAIAADHTYSYSVSAYDGSLNYSAPSSPLLTFKIPPQIAVTPQATPGATPTSN